MNARMLGFLIAAALLASCSRDEHRSSTSTAGPPSPTTTATETGLVTPPTGTATGPPTPAVVVPQRVRYAPGAPVEDREGVFFVDPATGAVEGWRLPPPVVPREGFVQHVVTPTGRYIAWAIMGAPLPEWLVLDTRSGDVRPRTRGWRPAFSPDESRVAVAEEDRVAVYRLADGSLERTFSFDALGAIVPEWSSLTWVLNRARLLVTFSVPDPPLYVTTNGRAGAGPPAFQGRLLDLSTGNIEDIGPTTALGASSPDGMQYFVLTNDSLEARAAADDRVQWRLTLAEFGIPPPEPWRNPAIATPDFSPDGRVAAVEVRSYDPPLYRVYMIDPASGRLQTRVEGAYLCGPGAWTADGRGLLVHGRQGDQYGVFIVSADGMRVRYATDYVENPSPIDPALAARPAYAPGGFAVQLVDLLSGSVTRTVTITHGGWDSAHQPLWSLDGRLVVKAPHGGHGGCGLGPNNDEELRAVPVP